MHEPSRAPAPAPTLSDLAAASADRPVRVGPYDVTGLLGRGGMGEVYDAVHREHGARVALKTLSHVAPERIVRFKTEFRSVAGVSHPNLVPLYELRHEGDLLFFTMERIEGTDFITGVRGPRPLPLSDSDTVRVAAAVGGAAIGDAAWTTIPDASDHRPTRRRAAAREDTPSLAPSIPRLRESLTQLVLGVHALHEAGSIHGDLKPSNVLVEAAGRVVVLDFGLVRAISPVAAEPFSPESIRPTTMAGTPEWMAPEQFLGETGPASDWYAVGLMLYEALTGVSAFASADLTATWYARVHVEPPPPHEIVADAPRDLSALASALLRPDPSQRPPGGAILELLSSDGASRARAATKLARTGFVGRAGERARLREAFERVRDGAFVVAHVIGPSGMGKSALLERLADESGEDGALVLTGRCYERETVPHKAFDGIVDDLAARLRARPEHQVLADLPELTRELVRVFPAFAVVPAIASRVRATEGDDAPVPVRELGQRAGEALCDLLRKLGARQPVVLRIEDLQWADEDSLALLGRVVDASIPRLLLAASFRGEETARGAALAAYLAHLRASEDRMSVVSIDVSTLPRLDAEALAATTLRALRVSFTAAGALAARIAIESGGIPFFVEELAHYVARHADQASPSMAGVSLETVLARRVQELPEAERALVEALSVADSPIPIAVWFAVAEVGSGALRALFALRGGQFVRSTGASAHDRVELHHDRIRDAVRVAMSADRILDIHLRLGRALAVLVQEGQPWLFDAVRHLGAASSVLVADERALAARLHLRAGLEAKRAAAFPLAYDAFRVGVSLLAEDAWTSSYDLALALHGGAAECAYLSSAWDAVDAHVAEVVAHGRTILDQLGAREVRIDACIARREYTAAVDAALDALRLLDVELPANPGADEVAREVSRAWEILARVGTKGLLALPIANDPRVVAAMRIQGRVSSAAYFARPALFPIVACRLASTSATHGLSPGTPYALAVFGMVLNSLEKLDEAHAFGLAALDLLARVPDRSLEARTRHVVNDLVCVFTVPLAGTLEKLRAVVDLGRRTGDHEYAAYAAHAYVHNAFYAGRELKGLHDEAAVLGSLMRGYEQVNALHVHAPFEQAIRCFLGRTEDPATLDSPRRSFSEQAALRSARAAGSRSAEHLVRFLMGMVRYHFGRAEDACRHLEDARPFLDGVASSWHLPIFHQYASLAIAALSPAARAARAAEADQSLAALRMFARSGPANFQHKVELVEGARGVADADVAAAIAAFDRSAAGASAGGFSCDEGLAHELAARALSAVGRSGDARARASAARDAYARWGSVALVRHLEGVGD